MAGAENEILTTPLLDDEERSAHVDAEASPLVDGAVMQTMISGMTQRRKKERLSLPDGSSTKEEGQSEEEKSAGQTHHQLEFADMRLALIYAQWIWPPMVYSGMMNTYDGGERWFASMIGNSLFMAVLWWIKTGATTQISGKQDNSAQRHLALTDILPTVVWGILAPFCAFLSEYPEFIILLSLAVLLSLSILFLIRCERYGCKSTAKAFSNSCSSFFLRATAAFTCFDRFKHIFKRMEEDYFEDLRKREGQDLKKLEEQQERLSYLESLGSKDPRKISNFQCIITTAIALSVAWSCFHIIHAQLLLKKMISFA